MTRLKEDWIKSISSNIKNIEKDLLNKTNLNLLELAARSANITIKNLHISTKKNKIAVIPITMGEGEISDFSETVSSIIKYLGFTTITTRSKDINGIHEAISKKANILFVADDNRFISLNTSENKIIDNNLATAKAFVEILESKCTSFSGQKILILGYGIIGQMAAEIIIEKNGVPVIFDIDNHKLLLAKKHDLSTISNIEKIKEYNLIYDATNIGEWLNKDNLNENSFISSPGVPLSLDVETYLLYKNKIFHDNLVIGVVSMLAMIVKK